MFIHLGHISYAVLSLLTFGSVVPVMAEVINTPVGLWTTCTSDGQTPASLVRIREVGGKLTGRIEKVLTPESVDKHCTTCIDVNKDRSLQGLEILRNLEPLSPRVWGDGEVLDPGNGKTYSAKIELLEDGNKLEVRGYLGITLIGRSQFWSRTN